MPGPVYFVLDIRLGLSELECIFKYIQGLPGLVCAAPPWWQHGTPARRSCIASRTTALSCPGPPCPASAPQLKKSKFLYTR